MIDHINQINQDFTSKNQTNKKKNATNWPQFEFLKLDD